MNNFVKHPITLSQLLKTSWYHYKSNFITILILTLIIHIPTNVLDYYMNLLLPVGAPVQLKIVFGLPTTLIGLLSFICINLLIKGVYESSTVSWSDCLKQAFKQYIGYTWINILILVTAIVPFLVVELFKLLPSSLLLASGNSPVLIILASIMSIASIVSVIFILPYLSFPTQAYLFKGIKGIQALKYSFSLVKGQYWRIFFLNAFIISIPIVLGVAYTALKPSLPSGYGLPIVYSTLFSIIAPFSIIYNALLYLHTDESMKPFKNNFLN